MTTGEEIDAIDEDLARLARATDGVRPRPGFEDRVMRAVGASSAGGRTWFDDVLVSARRLVPALAVVAVVGVWWAVASDRAADDAVAASSDAVDVEW